MPVDAGDLDLKSHLEICGKNATYISKTSQNDLLECVKSFIQDKIVGEIQSQSAGPYFSIMADEVTDTSNWEQLGIMVRYVKENTPVERLLCFENCERITGAALCDILVSTLKDIGLDPVNCRAQCFDGAGNMAGVQNGCAAKFQKLAPRAPYFVLAMI